MLVPMMTGMASSTVSTAGAQSHSLTSPHLCLGAGSYSRPEGGGVILTSRGDHADDDGGGGGRALDQQRDQDAHHQPGHWVGQDPAVLEDVPCCSTWMGPTKGGSGGASWWSRPKERPREVTVVTSDELEGRGEDVEGADEDVEEGEQQEQLPR